MAEEMKRKMDEIRKQKNIELEEKTIKSLDNKKELELKAEKEHIEERKRKREERKKKELEDKELDSEKLPDITQLQQKYEMMELTLVKLQDQILQFSNNLIQLSAQIQTIPSNLSIQPISYFNSVQVRDWIKKKLQIDVIPDDQLTTIKKCQQSISQYNGLNAKQLELFELLRRVIRQGKLFDKYLELQKQIQESEKI